MTPQTQLTGAKQPDLSLWMPTAKPEQRLKVKQDKYQRITVKVLNPGESMLAFE